MVMPPEEKKRAARWPGFLLMWLGPAAIAAYAAGVWLDPQWIAHDELYVVFRDFGWVWLGGAAIWTLLCLSGAVRGYAGVMMALAAMLLTFPATVYVAWILVVGSGCAVERTQDEVSADGRWRLIAESRACTDDKPVAHIALVRENTPRLNRQTELYRALDDPGPARLIHEGADDFTVVYADLSTDPAGEARVAVSLDPARFAPNRRVRFVSTAR